MGNGNGPGFSFSRPGDAPASLRYVNIANNEQAVDGRFVGQELREIPEPWGPQPVDPVIGGD